MSQLVCDLVCTHTNMKIIQYVAVTKREEKLFQRKVTGYKIVILG